MRFMCTYNISPTHTWQPLHCSVVNCYIVHINFMVHCMHAQSVFNINLFLPLAQCFMTDSQFRNPLYLTVLCCQVSYISGKNKQQVSSAQFSYVTWCLYIMMVYSYQFMHIHYSNYAVKTIINQKHHPQAHSQHFNVLYATTDVKKVRNPGNETTVTQCDFILGR